VVPLRTKATHANERERRGSIPRKFAWRGQTRGKTQGKEEGTEGRGEGGREGGRGGRGKIFFE
jgi:hypothetical protein